MLPLFFEIFIYFLLGLVLIFFIGEIYLRSE